jgi:hypothetical protein
MADNTILPGTGQTVRSVDRAGVKSQVVLLDLNTGGSEALLNGAIPTTSAASSQADGHSANIGLLADADTASTLTGLLKKLKALFSGGLPAALGTQGALKVEGVASGTAVPISGTVTVTQSTAANLKVDASGAAVPVTDNGGNLSIDDGGNSITVDAPVGTPAFVRLSDGAAAISTLPVSLASVPSHAVTNAGTFAVQAAQSGTWNVGTLTTITNVVHVDDNAGSLTVDNGGTFAVQATVAAAATNIAKAEDVASADADVGVPAMAIRKAAPANTSGTDGDYEMLQISAGRLWASATIDAALPAGANAIGKLAANDGVDVGDVTINNASGASSVNIQDGGNSITVDGTVTVQQSTASNLKVDLSGTAANATALNTSDASTGSTGSAVPAKAISVGLSDGTNLRGALAASAANLTATTTQAALLTAPYAAWNISNRPAAATKATVTKAAGAAGVRHVVTGFAFTIACGATAQTPLQVDVIDGATGGTTRLFSGTIAAPVNGVGVVALSCLSLIGTAATGLTIEFSAAGVAASVQAVSLWGYSTS